MSDVIRILIVEDEDGARETLKDILEHQGYSVNVAASARDALRAGEENQYHILLLDIHLPDQSGIEVLHALKQQQPDAEAVMVTGHASLENALQAFENASAYVEKPFDMEELLTKIRQISARQLSRLEQRRDQLRLKRDLEFYKELSNTDPLTHLYNGRHFRNVLSKESKRARRYTRPLVVMLLDIDFFKQYNDRYGHLDADNALVELAQIFEKTKRVSDLTARVGGEEFAFLLPETNAGQAYVFAERLRKQVSQTEFPLCGDGSGRLTLSIGIAELPEHTSDETELLRYADQALYQAKDAGRNQTCIYEKHDVED